MENIINSPLKKIYAPAHDIEAIFYNLKQKTTIPYYVVKTNPHYSIKSVHKTAESSYNIVIHTQSNLRKKYYRG